MLDIHVTVKGNRVVIEDLQHIAAEIPGAIDRGLNRVAKGIDRNARDYLSGAGGVYTGKSKIEWLTEGDSLRRKVTRKKKIGNTLAGGYPVPVRTGHLRRAIDWLKPGESKTGEAGTFTAGPHEVVVYDSAIYANVIHEGRGSSAKFGRRPFLEDALRIFNQGERIKQVIEEEIQKKLKG